MDQLHIMVMYISFMGFKKFQIFAQNPKLIAFGFTKKCMFEAKTDRGSLFFGCGTQNLDQL
jgi:hypothetical protein